MSSNSSVIPKQSRTKINKIINKMKESMGVFQKLEPLGKLIIEPVKMSKKALMEDFDAILPEHLLKGVNTFFSKKGKETLAQLVADLENTILKSKVTIKKTSQKKILGGDDRLVNYNGERRAFFNKSLCTALVAFFLGALLIWLAYENLIALNDKYNLDITTIGLLTNFEETIRNIPISLMQSLSKEAYNEIELRVKNGCMSVSGNRLADLISSMTDTPGMSSCIVDRTRDAMDNVVKMNSNQIINGISTCYRFTFIGWGMLTSGGMYTYRALTGGPELQRIGDRSSSSSSRRHLTRGGKKRRKTCKNNIKLHLYDIL